MIRKKHEEELAALCRKHGLAFIYLYGSMAEAGLALLGGRTLPAIDPLSDLDVGVVTIAPLPPPPARARMYAAVYNGLQDIFTPFRVDLALLEENHAVFQYEAVKGICVYQINDLARDEYEMAILRRAADFRPVLERYLQETLEGV